MPIVDNNNWEYNNYDHRIQPAVVIKPYENRALRGSFSKVAKDEAALFEMSHRNGNEILEYTSRTKVAMAMLGNLAAAGSGTNKFNFDISERWESCSFFIDGPVLTNELIPTQVTTDLTTFAINLNSPDSGNLGDVTYTNSEVVQYTHYFGGSTLKGFMVKPLNNSNLPYFTVKFHITSENKVVINFDTTTPSNIKPYVDEPFSVTLNLYFNTAVTTDQIQLTLNFKPPYIHRLPQDPTLVVARPIKKYYVIYFNQTVDFGTYGLSEAGDLVSNDVDTWLNSFFYFDNGSRTNDNNMYIETLFLFGYMKAGEAEATWLNISAGDRWHPTGETLVTVETNNVKSILESLFSTASPELSLLKSNGREEYFDVVGEVVIVERRDANLNGIHKSYNGEINTTNTWDFIKLTALDRLTLMYAVMADGSTKFDKYPTLDSLLDIEVVNWIWNNQPHYTYGYSDFRQLAYYGVTHDEVKRPMVIPFSYDTFIDFVWEFDTIELAVNGPNFPDAGTVYKANSWQHICHHFGDGSKFFIHPQFGVMWVAMSVNDYTKLVNDETTYTVSLKMSYKELVNNWEFEIPMTPVTKLTAAVDFPERWLTFNSSGG